MANIIAQIETIQQKLQQLLQRQQLLQKENEALKKELLSVAEKEKLQVQQIAELQQKLHAAQVGANSWNAEDRKAFQKKIDRYLKEIDHCLQQLHTA